MELDLAATYRREWPVCIVDPLLHRKPVQATKNHHKVRRYRGAGGISLRLSEQMGLEASFEGVHSTAGSNVGW